MTKHGLLDLGSALNRVQALSIEPADQAKMINLGATAWAFGITPEMMSVFGNIASSLRITSEDIRRLGYTGITDRIVYRGPCLISTSKPAGSTMTDPISQAAIDAALKRYQYPTGKAEDSTASHDERLAAALESAAPIIRKQIASEIRAEMPALTTRAATQTLRVCMEHAARIAEKGNQK